MSNEAQKEVLICQLVKDFGEYCEKVCALLFRKGKQSFQEIVRELSLPRQSMKKALMVLLHHHLVWYTEEEEGEIRVIEKTFYHLNTDGILMRINYPKIIHYTKQNFGEYGEQIILEIIQNGRLTLDQAVRQVYFVQKQLRGYIPNEFEEAENIKNIFLLLVQHRYLMRADIQTPTNLKQNSSETKEGASKKSNLSKAAQSDAKNSNGKRPNSELDPSKQTTFEETFWRLNPDRYVIAFSHQACIDLVSEKIHPIASTILRAMFRLTEPHLKSYKDQTSIPVHIEQLAETLKTEHNFQSDQLAQLNKYLEVMSKDKVGFITSTVSSYTINRTNIITVLKEKVVEGIISDKFGPQSLRIFRLLRAKHFLEEKKIAEMAMMPIASARTILYQMLAKNLLHLQEVPRTQDHSPARTIYLWTVKYNLAQERFASEVMFAISNMKMRLSSQYTQAHPLLSRVLLVETEAINAAQSNDRVVPELSDVDKVALRKLSTIEDTLEASILLLGNTLLYLYFF